MKTINTLILTLLVASSSLAASEEMNYLGVMSHDCASFSQNDKNKQIPNNFKLTPVEASKTVKENSSYGCFIKMGFGVYTDGKYYYFANNNLLFGKSKSKEIIEKYSFVVNPNTGKLISKPKYEKNT